MNVESIPKRKLSISRYVEKSVLEFFPSLEIHNEDRANSILLSECIKDEVLASQYNANRAVLLKIVNLTKRHFRSESCDVHGLWSLKPAGCIPPNSSIFIGTQSTLLNGTSGEVTYCTEDNHFFHIRWKKPSIGRCEVMAFEVEYAVDDQKHTLIEFYIQRNTDFSDIADWQSLLEYMENVTHFSKKELKFLYREFQDMAKRGALTIEDFMHWFPEIQNEKVVASLFSAFDEFRIRDNTIDFEEWARALSVISRGTFEEKVNLAFRICDLNRNGLVQATEVLEMASTISDIMVRLGYDRESYGDPKEIVTNLFMKRDIFQSQHSTWPHLHREFPDEVSRTAAIEANESIEKLAALSKAEFVEFAADEADIAECFGLFEFFRQVVIVPMEHKMGQEGPPQLSAWAIKGTRKSFLHFFKNLVVDEKTRRYFVIRDGNLAYFKTKPDTQNFSKTKTLLHSFYGPDEHEKPCRVISLGYAIARRLPYNTIVINAPKWTRKIYLNSKNDQKRWINTIRGNTRGNYRFRSSYPPRMSINAQWFVNGSEYFECLIPALHNAKKRIYIAGWHLSPQLLLSREHPINKDKRLDKILKKKAKSGVRIYILIWNASDLAFDMRSKWVQRYLNSLHRNIYVLQHPPVTPVSWSHHQKFVVIDEELSFLGGVDICFNRYEDGRYLVVDEEGLTYPGRDYMNLTIHTEANGRWEKEVLNRHQFPRLPWHDIQMFVNGEAARDVGKNFIQRWNHAMDTIRRPSKGRLYLLPLPKCKSSKKLCGKHMSGFICSTQILRQLSSWSGGVPETERSIYKAYLGAITSARHFIYIENQYFISSIDKDAPKNKIAAAIYNRIKLAIQRNEIFRVVIVLPVYPAGKLADISTLYLIKHTFETISRGGHSIIEKIKEEFPEVDPNNYISFHCLRNYGFMKGKAVTESIYVHAKLLIVDDRIAIIGSSNINDRSMRGMHDSEIGCYIEQEQTKLVDSVMAGQPFKVSPFVHNLRMRLWSDFLGIDNESLFILDPVCDNSYHNVWRAVSNHNTNIYSQVFGSIPEKAKTLGEYLNNQHADPQQVHKLREIQGFLINFPMELMEKETEMKPTIKHKEFMLPRKIYL